MSRWRIIVMLTLIGLPILAYAALGSYFLWRQGLSMQVWCPLAVLMILGYGLGWYWQRKQQLLKPPGFEAPLQWTERDRRAWKLVEERSSRAGSIDPAKLTEVRFYVDSAQDMSLELARFYHPHAADPVGSLTVPEILAVVELAAHDLSQIVDGYVPGSHLITIDHLRQAKKAVDLYPTFRNAYWLVSAFFSPINTGMRYAASELGMSTPLAGLQQDLIVWFYQVYLHRLGNYLIELNSGRLRVGATRYRELVKELGPSERPIATPPETSKPASNDQVDKTRQITLLIMGQVKAGKSSFVNALLGEQRALADALPATAMIQRYELQPAGVPSRLVLLDTIGYGHEGPKQDQLAATENAARQVDLLVHVMHAQNPGRQADLDMLVKLKAWFASQPELRMPPVVGVVTHIDLLSPALEWSPPYDWTSPKKPKEESIKEALAAVREQLGDHLVGVVPVCAAPGKLYGIDDWFLPMLAELLDEAKAVALLRVLRAEVDTGKVRKVFRQLASIGQEAIKFYYARQR